MNCFNLEVLTARQEATARETRNAHRIREQRLNREPHIRNGLARKRSDAANAMSSTRARRTVIVTQTLGRPSAITVIMFDVRIHTVRTLQTEHKSKNALQNSFRPRGGNQDVAGRSMQARHAGMARQLACFPSWAEGLARQSTCDVLRRSEEDCEHSGGGSAPCPSVQRACCCIRTRSARSAMM